MPQTNWKIAIIRRGDFGQRRRKIKKSYWLSENTTTTKFDTFAIKLRITFAAGGDRLAHCMGTQAVSGDQPWQNNVPRMLSWRGRDGRQCLSQTAMDHIKATITWITIPLNSNQWVFPHGRVICS